MHVLTQTSLMMAALISLSACQSAPVATVPAPTPVPGVEAPARTGFALTGKIGVTTPHQSGSAFFAWSQQDERFAIDLSGALGLGQTHIEGVPGHYTLTSSKTGVLSADSPEALLEQATGWVAPISQLRHWVQGQAAHADSPRTLDAQGRISQITEQDWTARLDYADAQSPVPHRLVMTQTSAGGTNRVVLSIQSRQP